MATNKNQTSSQKTSHAPASGERRAMSGYVPQYFISALITYDCLYSHKLESIRLADPEAGRLDDFQILTLGRLDAYQMKWSSYPSLMSFSELVDDKDESPSLINQLADGWVKIKETNKKRRVVVHLITNNQPSIHVKVPVTTEHKGDSHFAAFIEHVWKSACSTPPGEEIHIPPTWKPAWDTLRKASDLDEKTFALFVRDCLLEFNTQIDKRENQLSRDLEDIYILIQETVSDPKKTVELTKEKIIRSLGWNNRFELRNLHEFPEPDIPYRPVLETVKHLKHSLNTLDGGYISLLGSPGSGKSTLLTKTLSDFDAIFIKYYLYVPDSGMAGIIRGDAENFLHDITVELDRLGFIAFQDLSHENHINQLIQKLNAQFLLLHTNWIRTGRKVCILIDGLDHIMREQNPKNPLFDVLPPPQEVPNGVYIILGSQTDKDFPVNIKNELGTPDRKLQISSLRKEDVQNILIDCGLNFEVDEEVVSAAYQNTEGHPLALVYLIEKLRFIENLSEAKQLVQSSAPYKGNIEKQYQVHWHQIESNGKLIQLLGYLARLRKPDTAWIKRLTDTGTARDFYKHLSHFFRKEQEKLYFFHNSFRLFLFRRTAEVEPGKFDSDENIKLHHDIALICQKEAGNLAVKSEALYHLAMAKKHEAVLDLAQQDWFREQYLSLRNPKIIIEDIKYAMAAATLLQDIACMARILIIATEIASRESILNHSDYSINELLLEIDEANLTLNNIVEGKSLLCGDKVALSLVPILFRKGYKTEAKNIFMLASPHSVLYGLQKVEDGSDRSILDLWVEASVYFSDITEIEKQIQKINITLINDSVSPDFEIRKSMKLRDDLRFNLAMTLLFEGKFDDFEYVADKLIESPQKFASFWLYYRASIDRHLNNDIEKAKLYFNKALKTTETFEKSNSISIALSEGYFILTNDAAQAKAVIQGIDQPPLNKQLNSYSKLEPFMKRFRLNRILYTLGSNETPENIVPNDEEYKYEGIVKFERAICQVAHIWGLAWRGEQLSKENLKSIFLSICSVFKWPRYKEREWFHFHTIFSLRSEFFPFLFQHCPSMVLTQSIY